ncbi:ankyrin repeat-containing domain protein [Cadophora sp. MPI-SDFR-AT-0126]|nr:ankyrin repeat-containing domain protein [Leotiomycetes sp. MPI-SDFR-AT-0126]
MTTRDTDERTVSERRREQNRRAQRKFRERHGNRSYDCRPRTPVSSSGSTAGAEVSNRNTRAASISGSITPTSLTTKQTHDMAFSPASDPLNDLMDFGDNDRLLSAEVNANIFSLMSTPPQEPAQDIFQQFGNLAEATPPETESTVAEVPHVPIHMAVRQSSAKIVDLLLKHGVDFNDPDDAGFSPLMHACIRGDIEIVNTLLDAGAAISCSDGSQQSPLHWAVLHRREAVLKSLLKYCRGESRIVNAFNQDGQTPLHISIQTGFDAAVEALLAAGANARCPVRRPQSS